MAIKELRKRRPRGLSLASPSHSRRFSSFPSSTSDFGNGSVTTSGHYHTIESSTDVESTSAGEHVEEVTVTVSFVKKPVDELGVEVVDMTDTYAVEDDDVFLQEAELDEVERFVVEEGTQTVDLGMQESSMQTSPLLLLSEEVQTIDERPTTESVDCQTDEAVLATQSTSYAAQTEVSMFTVKKEDRSALEAEHQVRFNVDNSTSMERKLYSSIAVQNFGPKTSSIPVQCVQEECEATVETRDASEQSIFALVDSIVQAVTLQSDCGVDSPLLSATNSTVQTEAPLWSDFDRILLEEPYDASEQTSPVARCDAVSSCEVEISSTAVQTAKEATAEQECDVRVEMGDGEVQAVVESNEIASGLSDCDNWLKVYLAELDDEKRQRMMDIGIQTGVLARVQHMYGNHASLEADGLITADSSRPAIRLVEFDDGTPNLGDGGESSNRPSPSSTSLPQSPVDRLATSPQSSRTVIRRQSLKRSQPSIDVSRRVSDLRARFEKSKKSDGDGAGLVRARSSSLER
ncbi:hypothetical protein Q1695_001861 [Nippostrongylus brasiliensis]|nr:hypothetical protein Q1695_001861 [Nippostrongylus brasiliensis]